MEAIGCAFDKEHSESLSTADAEDSVSALSTTTLANETTQHTLQKKTNVLSEKGRNNLLVLMMESCINSITSPGPQNFKILGPWGPKILTFWGPMGP